MSIVNHPGKVANYVAKMLEDDSFHDVTIVCDNGEVKANKGILCASSKYFAGLFNNNTIKTEDSNCTISVPSTSSGSSTKAAMEVVVKYLHTGKMEYKEFTLNSILDLLKLLELMGEENLFSAIEDFTLSQIRNKKFSYEQILINASTSEKFNFENITKGVLNLLLDNVKEIANLPEVKYLTSSLLEKLFVVHEEESDDFDREDDESDDNDENVNVDDDDNRKGRKRRRIMKANEKDSDGEEKREKIESTNYRRS